MRKTKIICTIGPTSETVPILKELLIRGMNVARLNFSHGTHEEHRTRIAAIRQASQEVGIPVAIMLDTKGPEIRMGLFKNGKAVLQEGAHFTLTIDDVMGTDEMVSIGYEGLVNDVVEGTQILLDDGNISLRVKKIEAREIHCLVENGGVISDRKKVNVPEVQINLPGLTARDVADIKLGVEEKVDFIACSFIRSAQDVIAIRKILEDLNSDIHLVSKIENRQGVENLEEIIKVSDGIMIARGDLGVEIPAEEVPIVQKKLIDKCNFHGKPVITATQMLESMVRNPRPTRAEASDVANAIYDGSDAIMLSGETANGRYPVEAATTMARIADRIEASLNWHELMKKRAQAVSRTTTEAVSHATCDTAMSLGAAAIITATQSGYTARMVSKYRSQCPIVAVTPDQRVAKKLLLIWGVYPLVSAASKSTDVLIETAVETSLKAEYIKNGDLVIITAGVPTGIAGTTNLIKVHTVGKVLVKGTGIGSRSVTGKVVVAKTPQEATELVKKGDILVTPYTDRDFMPAIQRVSALIIEQGGMTSHGAIVGINLGIPVIVGAHEATTLIKQDSIVTIDPERGLIYSGSAKVI